MKKIVFYDDTVNNFDIVKKFARQAKNNFGVSSIQQITGHLSTNSNYELVVISGHGMEGYQGIGSGVERPFQQHTDLENKHMADQTLNTFLSLHKHSEITLAGYEKFTMRELWKMGCNMKNGGVLFLAGCSVAKGSDGIDLLKKIGLSIQNNIKVIAATCPIAMDKRDRTIVYTNADKRRDLNTEDLRGCQGERILSEQELENINNNFSHSLVT